MSNLSMSEQLMYITVRIECQYANGTSGTGTGFFFRFLDVTINVPPRPARQSWMR